MPMPHSLYYQKIRRAGWLESKIGQGSIFFFTLPTNRYVNQ